MIASLSWPLRLVWFYYLATPLFWGADLLWQADFRVAWLDEPGYRSIYYLLCITVAVMGCLRSRWLALLGLLESSVNLLLLAVSVMLPVYQFPAGDDGGGLAFTSASGLLTFLLSAAVWLAVFHSAQQSLRD